MLKHLLIIAVFTAFTLLTACQTKEQEKENGQSHVSVNSNQNLSVNSPSSKEEDPLTEEERIRDLFLNEFQLGMSESEVRNLFGTSFSFIENALSMEGKETWRYDLGTEKDYQFDDRGIDQVDMEGLKQGRIKQQLFVDWSSDGHVISATLYMSNAENDGYYEYELLSEGSRVEKLYQYN